MNRRLAQAAARAHGAWRDYGPWLIAVMLAARTLRLLGASVWIQSYLLVAQPVSGCNPGKRRGKYRLEELDAGSPLLAAIPRPRQVIADRFEQGARCLAMLRGEELIGCAWLCAGRYVEDDVRAVFQIGPPRTAVWDFDIWIAEQHRLGFAFANLWSLTLDTLEREGVHWTMSRISEFNLPSVRAHMRLGARRLGRLTFVRIGSVQIMMGTVKPWCHLSLADQSRPLVTLRAPADAAVS